MEYTKVWLSYDQQANLLLEERGLIADREFLIRHLKEIGYYLAAIGTSSNAVIFLVQMTLAMKALLKEQLSKRYGVCTFSIASFD